MKTIKDFDREKMKQIRDDIENHFGWDGFLIFLAVIYAGQAFKHDDVGRSKFNHVSKKFRAFADTLGGLKS